MPHSVTPDAMVVEIWYDGNFIGQVVGADRPGVRILSKYAKIPIHQGPIVMEIRLGVEL